MVNQINNLHYKRSPKPNDTIWFFDVQTDDGKLYKPSNKNKLIFLWTSTCGPCKRVIPDIIRLSEVYTDIEVKMIAIDDDVKKWQKKVLQYSIPNQLNLIDLTGINGKFFMSTNPYAFPTYLLLDRNNKLVLKTEGIDDLKLVEMELKKLK